MKTKIKHLCACGCRQITGPGRKYINGHNRKGIKPSEETKIKMSLAQMGNANSLGHKHSKETKQKMALSKIKDNPNYEYCGAWQDKEYKKDLKKDYCENVECKGNYKQLSNHHINLNKFDCKPFNIMTLCSSCSSTLHWKLDSIANIRGANHKNYLTINRKDHITYVLKKKRQIIATIRRKDKS